MSKFYILMVILLIIAIINLLRALKEKNDNRIDRCAPYFTT